MKPLLTKYQSLMMLQPPRLNVAATYTQTQQRIGPRHEGFVETARKGDIDFLLEGDSITDWWVQGDANKAMFHKYFGSMKDGELRHCGDTTQGVLWGLKNGEGQGFQPKAVMVMIGTNNTGGTDNAGTATAAEIAEGVGAVVQEMRTDFPQAKILLLAIFPRGLPGDSVRTKIAQINSIISRLDDQKHVFYLDIGAKFLDDTGTFLPDSFRAETCTAGQGRRHLGRRCKGQISGTHEVIKLWQEIVPMWRKHARKPRWHRLWGRRFRLPTCGASTLESHSKLTAADVAQALLPAASALLPTHWRNPHRRALSFQSLRRPRRLPTLVPGESCTGGRCHLRARPSFT